MRAKARRVRERLEPETIALRTTAAIQDRAVSTEHVGDGMGWLNLYAQAPVIGGIDDRLTRAARARRDAGDPRTISQLRADIAAALLLGTADDSNDGGNDGADEGDTGTQSDTRTAYADPEIAPDLRTHPSFDFPQDLLARIRPHILVTVPVVGLMGITDQPGSLQGCVPIDVTTARILAANAPSFTRLLTHPQNRSRPLRRTRLLPNTTTSKTKPSGSCANATTASWNGPPQPDATTPQNPKSTSPHHQHDPNAEIRAATNRQTEETGHHRSERVRQAAPQWPGSRLS